MTVLGVARAIGETLAVALVIAGIVPVLAGTYQILLGAWHGVRNHYGLVGPRFPRTAIILPAWNEASVLETSIDRMMGLDYPPESLRVYVVDDASTDATPDLVRSKAVEYPGRVFLLRREKGGQGKAHTLNHGLGIVLAEDWMEALLITDADVVYLPPSLRLMARHLADPQVGAVTAYIKEGSGRGNYMTRFIAFEYVAAQAAARRGQNVIGVLACLAGGSQLHTRENLEALGGRIDTSSLAEDTFTTFNTQLGGRRVVFEPHAVVLAEEPGSIAALWKQRMRWARGNVQVTLRFRRLWFRRRPEHGLGGWTFGAIWFSLFVQPLLMIAGSVSLLVLFFTNPHLASVAFKTLWITAALGFLLVVMLVASIDPATGRRSWVEALLFPGAVSLALIAYTLFPRPLGALAEDRLADVGVRLTDAQVVGVTLFFYVWPALSMLASYLAKVVEARPGGRWISPLLVYLVGYGPLLCAITLAAYFKEWRGAEMKWEKTEKSGKAMTE